MQEFRAQMQRGKQEMAGLEEEHVLKEVIVSHFQCYLRLLQCWKQILICYDFFTLTYVNPRPMIDCWCRKWQPWKKSVTFITSNSQIDRWSQQCRCRRTLRKLETTISFFFRNKGCQKVH